MGRVDVQHKDLAAGRWGKMPFASQMGNIGSEVSRALKWRSKGKTERSQRAFYRALELMDLSIEEAKDNPESSGRLRELCRAREELCDYFAGDNLFQTKPERLLKYYDEFAVLHKGNPAGDL